MGFGRVGRISAITLLSLLAVIILAIVIAQLFAPRGEVLAAPSAVGNEPWIEIACLTNHVEEGDDFRLAVHKKFDSEWPHETIKVF